MRRPADGLVEFHAGGGHGASTLFDVRFASGMTDRNLALLSSRLGLTTHVRSETDPSYRDVGLARLDNCSGLFLQRGTTVGTWVLGARTWGAPGLASSHEWHVAAAYAAQLLDPTVTPPERLPAIATDTPQLFVGGCQHKRLTKIRRRLAGLR